MIPHGVHQAIPGWVLDLSPSFLIHLIDPAVRSLLLAAFAGMLILLARGQNASLRLSVWKAVVCVALAMPFLGHFIPALPISVPTMGAVHLFADPNKETTPASVVAAEPTPRPSVASRAIVIQRTTRGVHPAIAAMNSVATPARKRELRAIRWSPLAAALYFGVAFFFALRFVLGWFLAYRLRKLSTAIVDENAIARFESHARAAQLHFIPRFAETDRLSVPLTCGVMRQAVLFPADWRTWDSQTLDAVIAHEISHVARRDALAERLALVHRIFFWFSPLAWWLRRCLADLAEEASDEAALAAGTEPTKYAEILLGFLRDLHCTSRRTEWQGVAMAQVGRAEKRFDRILNGRSIVTMKIRKPLAIAVALASIPVVLVAASLQPRHLGKQIILTNYPSRVPAVAAQQPSPEVPTAPIAPVKPAVPAAPVPRATPSVAAIAAPAAVATPATVATPAVRAVPSAVPAPRALPARAAVAAPPQAAKPPQPLVHNSYSYSTGGDNSYAVFSGDTQTMSGSFGHADMKKLQALHKSLNTDFVWFERDGKAYVITDPKLVKRASEAFAQQAELGRKQGELGEQQGVLGEQQGKIGEQQGVLGEKMATMSAELADANVEGIDVTAQLQSLREQAQSLAQQAATDSDLKDLRSKLAQMEKEIAEAQEIAEKHVQSADVKVRSQDAVASQMDEQIETQMSKLSAEQAALGEQEAKLGQEQAELGEQQAVAAAKAEAEIKTIIDEALAHGAAQLAPK